MEIRRVEIEIEKDGLYFFDSWIYGEDAKYQGGEL